MNNHNLKWVSIIGGPESDSGLAVDLCNMFARYMTNLGIPMRYADHEIECNIEIDDLFGLNFTGVDHEGRVSLSISWYKFHLECSIIDADEGKLDKFMITTSRVFTHWIGE